MATQEIIKETIQEIVENMIKKEYLFAINDLTENDIKEIESFNPMPKNTHITYDDLNILYVSYMSFEGDIREDGVIIANKKIAKNLLQIFNELLEIKFPIEKIKPIHLYKGNDYDSMSDNNSSCFNYRNFISEDKEQSSKLSMHAYGLAVDINPKINPYITIDKDSGRAQILPKEAVIYANRLTNNHPGKINQQVIDIFKKYGFSWGGYWKYPIDYHHFQITIVN